MTKKIIYAFVVALLLLTLGFALSACSEECPPEGIDLSGVTFEGKTLDYNGEPQSVAVSGTLPDRVTVEYFGNGVVNAGEHTVTAKFYYGGHYIGGADKTAKIKINKVSLADALLGVSFPATKVFYDGEQHSIAVVGELPDAVRVTYEGNGVSAVGTHTVVAKFNVDERNYYPLPDMTSTITIAEETVAPEIPSLSGISMSDKTVAFNGEQHGILISGTLPEGVTVKYDGTAQSAMGEYTVVAKFFFGGLEIEGASLSATLTITAPTVDLSGITLDGKTVDYNGEPQSLAVSGTLPAGVIVTYEGNGKTEAGEHAVVAKLYYKGVYLEGRDLTANIVINKVDVDMSGVSFSDTTVYCDGKAHSIAVNGALPEGVISVSYDGNGKVGAGAYTVVASFKVDNNHNAVENMTATMTIVAIDVDMSGVSFPDVEFVYDGTEKSLTLPEGTELPFGIVLIGYEGNGKTEVGEYPVTAKFSLNGEYSSELDLKAFLKIVPATVGVSAAKDVYEFDFDGKKHSVGEEALVWADGEKPDFVNVIAKNVERRFVGTYTYVFGFELVGDEFIKNYKQIADIEVTMVIKAAEPAATDGLVFVKNPDGESYYVSGYTGTSNEVIIPAEYDGLPVTAIAARAFENKTSLEYVRVPDSVVAIGQAAFRGCSKLDAITLPFIGGSVGTSKEYLGYIFGASDYGANAQFVPASLKSVELSDACTLIPAYSFYRCTGITEVKIGAGVTEIGSSAFRGCTSMKSIYIPATVTDIPAAANAYNSPFFETEDLVIYLEGSVQSGYGIAWNIVSSDSTAATVKTGYTFEEYAAEIAK